MSRKSKKTLGILLTIVMVCSCVMTVSAAPGRWSGLWDKWYSYISGSQETAEEVETEEEVKESITLELVSNTQPTQASRKISLDWNSIEGCDGYEVQRSTKEDFASGVTTKETTSSMYNLTIMGVSPAIYYYPAHATYYFRVRAIYGEERGDWSNIVIAIGK